MIRKKQALVLAAFGTSGSARKTYASFEKAVVQRFPDSDIYWAFTSNMLRRKLAGTDTSLSSPRQVLARLKRSGYEKVILQSLHIVPGAEFEKLIAAAEASPLQVSLGRPLLGDEIDCRRLVAALQDRIADPAETITVIAGHGSRHSSAGSLYLEFYECLKKRYRENVLLAMVEGVPAWSAVRDNILNSSARNVRFIPLMFVAGEHVRNDIMGRTREAWKNQLDGFTVDGSEPGLGCNENVRALFCDHIYDAAKKL